MPEILIQSNKTKNQKNLRDFMAFQGVQDEASALRIAKSNPGLFTVIGETTQPQASSQADPYGMLTPSVAATPNPGSSRPMSTQIGSALKAGVASGARDLSRFIENPTTNVLDTPLGQKEKIVDQSAGTGKPPTATGPVLHPGTASPNKTVNAGSGKSTVVRKSTESGIKEQKQSEKNKVQELQADSAQDTGIIPSIAKGVARSPFDILRYALATSMGAPLPVAIGVTDAITEADEGAEAAAKAGIKGTIAGAGMKLGGAVTGKIASPFVNEFQKNSPGLFQKVIEATGIGTGGAVANAGIRAAEGQEAPDGTFLKDLATQAVIGSALPSIRSKKISPSSTKTGNPPATPAAGPVKPVEAPLGLGRVQMRVGGRNVEHVLETGQEAFTHNGQFYAAKTIETPQGPQVEIRNLATKETKTAPMGKDLASSVADHLGGEADGSKAGSSLSRGLKSAGSKLYDKSMKFKPEYDKFKRMDVVDRAAETGNKIGVPEGTGDAERRYQDISNGLKKASIDAEANGVLLNQTDIQNNIRKAIDQAATKGDVSDILREYNSFREKHGLDKEGEITPTQAEDIKSNLNRALKEVQDAASKTGSNPQLSSRKAALSAALNGIRQAQAASITEPVVVDGKAMSYREAARLAGLDKTINEISGGLEGEVGAVKAGVEAGRAATFPTPYRALSAIDKYFFTPKIESGLGKTLYNAGKKLEGKSKPPTPVKPVGPQNTGPVPSMPVGKAPIVTPAPIPAKQIEAPVTPEQYGTAKAAGNPTRRPSPEKYTVDKKSAPQGKPVEERAKAVPVYDAEVVPPPPPATSKPPLKAITAPMGEPRFTGTDTGHIVDAQNSPPAEVGATKAIEAPAVEKVTPQLGAATEQGTATSQALKESGPLPIDKTVVDKVINADPVKLTEYHDYARSLLEKAKTPAEVDAAKKTINSINYVRYTKSITDKAYGNSMEIRDQFIFDEPTAAPWESPGKETAKEPVAEVPKTAPPPTVKAAKPVPKIEKVAVKEPAITPTEVAAKPVTVQKSAPKTSTPPKVMAAAATPAETPATEAVSDGPRRTSPHNSNILGNTGEDGMVTYLHNGKKYIAEESNGKVKIYDINQTGHLNKLTEADGTDMDTAVSEYALKGNKVESKPTATPTQEAPKEAKAPAVTQPKPAATTPTPKTSATPTAGGNPGSTPGKPDLSIKDFGDGSYEIRKSGKRIGTVEKIGSGAKASYRIYKDGKGEIAANLLSEMKSGSNGETLNSELLSQVERHLKGK